MRHGRFWWVPGILVTNAALGCSTSSAPAETVEMQQAALGKAPERTAPPSAEFAAPTASSRRVECTTAPAASVDTAARHAEPARGAPAFDGDRSGTESDAERAERSRSEDAYRREVAAENAEAAKRVPPKSPQEQALDQQRAVVARAQNAAFEQALNAQKSRLDALSERERLAAYSALKDQYLGGAK